MIVENINEKFNSFKQELNANINMLNNKTEETINKIVKNLLVKHGLDEYGTGTVKIKVSDDGIEYESVKKDYSKYLKLVQKDKNKAEQEKEEDKKKDLEEDAEKNPEDKKDKEEDKDEQDKEKEKETDGDDKDKNKDEEEKEDSEKEDKKKEAEQEAEQQQQPEDDADSLRICWSMEFINRLKAECADNAAAARAMVRNEIERQAILQGKRNVLDQPVKKISKMNKGVKKETYDAQPGKKVIDVLCDLKMQSLTSVNAKNVSVDKGRFTQTEGTMSNMAAKTDEAIQKGILQREYETKLQSTGGDISIDESTVTQDSIDAVYDKYIANGYKYDLLDNLDLAVLKAIGISDEMKLMNSIPGLANQLGLGPNTNDNP